MPARPYQRRPANGNSITDSTARMLDSLGAYAPGVTPTVLVEVPGLKYFHRVSARLLRKYPRHKIGTIVKVELTPDGCFSLINSGGRCFDSDAYDGKDFDFVSEKL